MSCPDPQIAGLLPDYVSGHLGDADAAAVVAHLGACPVCRDLVETMMVLKTGKSGPQRLLAADGHLEPSVLSWYFQDQRSMPPELLGAVEDHLSSCTTCVADLDSLQELEVELRRSATLSARDSRPTPIRRVWQGFAGALSAAAVLLIAGSFAAKHWRVTPHVAMDWGTIEVFTLREMQRASGAMSIVTRSAGEPRVGLVAPVYHDTASFRYGMRVRRMEAGDAVDLSLSPEFTAPGKIQVGLPLHDLPDGDYILEVIEVDRRAPSDSTVLQYPFQLQSTP
ncbi:MAG: zf-HC2 domain-containing protein [Candidatus Zixiibacteriota bacterium]